MGKPRQAEQILLKAAGRNKIPVENVKLALETHENQAAVRLAKGKEKYNITHLFRTPNMRMKTIYVSINWLVCGICFFGLAQYMGHLDGDLFINVAVSSNSATFSDYIKYQFLFDFCLIKDSYDLQLLWNYLEQ
jgi:chromosome transmission fidelity protein 4